MCEKDILSAAENDVQQEDAAYGCIFCITGNEQIVADQIQLACPEACAVTMRQLKYRTHKKVKTRTEDGSLRARMKAL